MGTQSDGATILSAAVGTDTGTACPSGETGRDNMPVTFDWFMLGSSIDVADFAVDVSQPLGDVAPHEITQLEAAPFIVDVWTLTPQLLADDANACSVGTTFVRVVWSNGMTAYPTGGEVGADVAASYQADYRLPSGEMRSLTPLALGDLSDHPPKVPFDDNMHDLCLDVPSGAVLQAIEVAGNVLQDPNGDPNGAQTFEMH